MKYDVIVIGAGSAGGTLATRLSESPNRSVLLLEAGPDYPDLESTPATWISYFSGLTYWFPSNQHLTVESCELDGHSSNTEISDEPIP